MSKKKESNITTETIPISSPLSKDDLQFQKLLQFANLTMHIKKDLNSTQQVEYSFHKNFTKDEVMKWMANPQKYEKKLRDLSRFLYDTSSHYKRLVQYFATMLTFDYTVEPYGITDFEPTKDFISTFKKKYVNTVNFLEIMNVKHEFAKLSIRAWIDDVAFGYEYKTKDSYYIDILNPDYCAISSVEDGSINFSFNFQFFDTYPKELNRFSDEFKEKYDIYKTDRKNNKWQELDSKKTICIKINETIDYNIPPFAGVFEEVYSLEDYKQLKLSKTELQNYLLLVAKIPYLKDSTTANNFALEMNKAIEYFDMAMDSLPEQVGGMLSPFESVEAVKIDRSDKNSDNVSEAESALYNSAGVSQLLFNSDGAGAALTKSIIVDENVAFDVLRQFERWINRKLKEENNKVIKFRVTFLDITRYSKDDYIKGLKEASSLGLPVKLKYSSAMGQSPSSALNMEFLENSVLNIVDNWVPLQSSHTQSGDTGGKPKSNEGDLSQSGEVTIANDSNNPDSRS